MLWRSHSGPECPGIITNPACPACSLANEQHALGDPSVSLFPKHLFSNTACAVLEISLLVSLGKYLNGVLLRVLKVSKEEKNPPVLILPGGSNTGSLQVSERWLLAFLRQGKQPRHNYSLVQIGTLSQLTQQRT